jgi:predicted kinase
MMKRSTGKLYFFCGKMAAGKSTLATKIAARENAVMLVQDKLLDGLFPGAIVDVASYVKHSTRLNRTLAPHLVDLLSKGLAVVIDFPGNTRRQRAWFREIIQRSGAEHELHYLDTPDEMCRRQLKERSRHLPPGTPWTSDADFDVIAAHFDPPAPDEAFTVIVHKR